MPWQTEPRTNVSRLIADRLGAGLHQLERAEPCFGDYEATVSRCVQQQENDARPQMADSCPT